MKRVVRSIALLVACAALVIGVRSSRAHLAATAAATQTYEDVYYLPRDPRVLRLMSLGFRETVADLLWMRALLYYADQLEDVGQAAYAMNYAESIVELDPDFAEVYHWAGLIPFYLRRASSLAMREQGAQLIVHGSDRMPSNPRLAWDAAATVQYELLASMPDDAPNRGEWERTAARLMMRAIRLGSAPDWLSISSASVLQRLGETERAIRFLEEMIATTRDPDTAASLASELSTLRHSADTIALQSLIREQQALHQADFPYVSEATYMLLGRRRFPHE